MDVPESTSPLTSGPRSRNRIHKRISKACDLCRLKKAKARNLTLLAPPQRLTSTRSAMGHIHVRAAKRTMPSVHLASEKGRMTSFIRKGKLTRPVRGARD